jgi:fructose-1,6-bisphosphatase I / sedoheptulose-1,7-bisphosphatase
MLADRTTLTRFLIEERRRHPGASGDLNALILDVALACKAVAARMGYGVLDGMLGTEGTANVHGEPRQTLDVVTHDLFVRATEWGGQVAGMVSEKLEEPHRIPERFPRGKYLLVFDPLDGSSNIDINGTVGSIFSILRAPGTAGGHPGADAFLQPGTEQVCAGYAIYGPSTMLVLTVGTGVHGFTLDPRLGEFILTRPRIRIPRAATELTVNAANRRFWEPAARRYVDECLAGRSGPRGRDFSVRWVAALVAEAHRILVRGGVFLSPRGPMDPGRPGRLRLLSAVNPVAFLVEQAGGRASTGRERVLDVLPTDLHQCLEFVFGAADEVERIEAYHRAPSDAGLTAPLYSTRGLFRVYS